MILFPAAARLLGVQEEDGAFGVDAYRDRPSHRLEDFLQRGGLGDLHEHAVQCLELEVHVLESIQAHVIRNCGEQTRLVDLGKGGIAGRRGLGHGIRRLPSGRQCACPRSRVVAARTFIP